MMKEKYRYICDTCSERKKKEVKKEFKGQPKETCNCCGGEMKFQKRLVGTNGADLEWIYWP